MSGINGISNQVLSLVKSQDQDIAQEAGHWPRVFTKEGVHPFDEIEWKTTDAEIKSSKGEIVFEQRNIEVPAWWNQNTTNIVADKYFRIIDGVRENSVKQIFLRISKKIREWGSEQNFFNSEHDAEIFEHELIYALVHQYGAFNSPVWFNLGVPGVPQQASACFISGVDDSLEDIMKFQKAEIDIFRGGSGSGANFSKLRSSYEKIERGSYTSGPLAFMRGFDQFAGAMKSGGGTRSAAKMSVLDIDHPDILETRDGRPGFIKCKSEEEKLAHALVKIGYSVNYDDPNGAYKRVMYQNANNSVSIPDAFMQAVIDDSNWYTRERKTGKVVHTYKARELWKEIAEAAWTCGDPGLQFHDSINKWHTIPKTGEILASNPCSEYLNVDNTACNLCAINLTKFFDDRKFNYKRFRQSVKLFSTSQMIMVDMASYPTEEITKNSKKLRPIGTNFGDLGALLMKLGYGYDSDEGRAIAARLSSLMTGIVYETGAKLAARLGAFQDFEINKKEMLNVMDMHQEADQDILKRWNLKKDPIGDDVISTSTQIWKEVAKLGEKFGFYNCQASVQAPLGTISFLMSMSTTGVEPAYSLVSYKKLVGGGSMKIVNSGVRDALESFGYSEDEVNSICRYIEIHDCIDGALDLKSEHLNVFDCAAPSGHSTRFLTPMAHLKMMAAIQPLITCAISKTVNLPSSATVDDIADIYLESWRLGIKAVALYRDGCKASQPLATKSTATSQGSIESETKAPEASTTEPIKVIEKIIAEAPRSLREKLPVDVKGSRHKFYIDGYKGYIQVNEYPDGRPGEVFFKLGKPGSTISGLIDSFTQLLSIALQYGIPLDKLISCFVDTRFEPAGMTNNPQIRFTTSLYDYLFKYLSIKYDIGEYASTKNISDKSHEDVKFGISKESDSAVGPLPTTFNMPEEPAKKQISTPPCMRCGGISQRSGSCYICTTCGTSSGCS